MHEPTMPITDGRETWTTFALLLLVGAVAALSWHLRFVVDDALISARYAWNLVHGHGLVYNIGERVEGYTNFLWVLLSAVPIALGFDAITSMQLMGIACLCATLVTNYAAARWIFNSKILPFVAVVALGTNLTFLKFGTSGLETQFQTFLFMLTMYFLVRQGRERSISYRYPLALSGILTLALLTRMDSGLLAVVAGTTLFFRYWRYGISLVSARMLRLVGVFLVPVVVVVGSWLVWKYAYYGDIFPNTVHTKITDTFRGLFYATSFYATYWLIPFPLLFLMELFRKKGCIEGLMLPFFVMCCLWTAYIVIVGGGWMGYRFFTPILPLLMLLSLWVAFKTGLSRIKSLMLAAVIFAGALFHPLYGDAFFNQIGNFSINRLAKGPFMWRDAGMALGSALEYDPDVTVACTPAGMIAYYSRLTVIDMHGLCDPWVAKHGRPFLPDTPGHTKIADLAYLQKRKTHLVIGFPWIEKPGETPRTKFSRINFRVTNLNYWEIDPPHATAVKIPLKEGKKLVALYLEPHPRIDELIKKGIWEEFPLQSHYLDGTF